MRYPRLQTHTARSDIRVRKYMLRLVETLQSDRLCGNMLLQPSSSHPAVWSLLNISMCLEQYKHAPRCRFMSSAEDDLEPDHQFIIQTLSAHLGDDYAIDEQYCTRELFWMHQPVDVSLWLPVGHATRPVIRMFARPSTGGL